MSPPPVSPKNLEADKAFGQIPSAVMWEKIAQDAHLVWADGTPGYAQSKPIGSINIGLLLMKEHYYFPLIASLQLL